MKKTFEASVKRLDEIVRVMEKGDMPLEESMKLFEEGNTLVKACQTLLDEAEQKVKLLDGTSGLVDWEGTEDEPTGAV